MSKTLRTVGMVVAAVALVATTAGVAAPAVAATATTAASAGGIAGVSAATLTAIGTYASVAAGALSIASAAAAPGVSQQGSATTFATNPQSGLPYAMGRTRMSGLRFFAATNSRPGYTKFQDLLWFGALLSIGGQIEGLEKFTADNVVVSFDASGNAVGTYHDYMGQKVHLGGPQAAAVNLTLMGGAAPGWTSAHRLSGMTHAMWCLRFNKEGDLYGAGAPEPAWIGKWVKVYDPRLDSTYLGGDGPCRALDETTYVWSQNPGLHALTWSLGRWDNGKRTCGIGAPIANIRIAEFVENANICDANGWKVGGVEWTTDTKWNTLRRILQAGGARPTKSRGMLGCLTSTPRTAIATIHSRHLVDKLQLVMTKSRRDRYNTVIPRYVDENSDWSLISGTAIEVETFVTSDRGPRTKEIDFPLVQVFSEEEATQPAELAAYEIVNSREAGPFTWSTGPEFIGIKSGDVINLNVPEEGMVYQPMLVTKATPDPASGKINFAGETETHSKHDFALGRTTTPPAPFTLTAPDLKPPAPETANWVVSGTTTGEGLPALVVIGTSEMPSADAVLLEYRKAGTEDWYRAAILSAAGRVQHVISPLESATVYEVRVGYRVGAIDGLFSIIATVATGSGKLSTIETGATVGATTEQILEWARVQEALNLNILKLARLAQTTNAILQARATLDGKPVGTVIVDVRSTAESAIEDLKLLGARNGAGTAFNLDLNTVMVDGAQSLAQKFSSVEAMIDGPEGVAASVEALQQALVNVDGTALAKVVLVLKANGRVGGAVATNDGSTVTLDLDFDVFRFWKPDGTLLLEAGPDGTVYMPNVTVDTLKFGSMDAEFQANRSITSTQISQKLPGGLIMKTGRYRALIGDETSMSIVFDEPFPTECRSFIPVPAINAPSNYRDLWIQIIGTPTRFGASIQTQSSTSNNNNIDGFDWTAWGV